MYNKNDAANPPPSRADGMPVKVGVTFRKHLDHCAGETGAEGAEAEGSESPAKEKAEEMRKTEDGSY